MLRAQRRDPAKAQAKCAFATNYPLANRQLRSPLILRYRMQRDKPFALISPLKKASLTGFHATAKHIAAKAVSPSSETMRTI